MIAIGTIASRRSRHTRLARRFALAMILVPAIATVLAFLLLFARGTLETATLPIFVVMYLVCCLGVEVGFHRMVSHRSFDSRPTLRHFLLAAGSMAGQGPVITWSVIHRLHHRRSDDETDPHSPHAPNRGSVWSGFWHSHIGWMLDHHAPDVARIGPDLVRRGDIIFYNRSYFAWFLAGLALPSLLGGILGGMIGALEGLLWGGFVRIFFQHHVTWSINSVCHLVGKRPYATKDHSRNVALLSLLSMGASWHNNHHAYAGSATNDHRWYQLDPGAWFLRLCVKLGQVTRIIDGPPGRHRTILNKSGAAPFRSADT